MHEVDNNIGNQTFQRVAQPEPEVNNAWYSTESLYLRLCVSTVINDESCTIALYNIMKTCLYNFDPLQPHFYIVKLGFTGVYIIFLISA